MLGVAVAGDSARPRDFHPRAGGNVTIGPDDDQLKIEARLAAVEYVLSEIFVLLCADLEKTPAEVNKFHRDLLARIQKQPLQRLSAMFNDIAAAELDYAVRCLISMQRRMMGLPQQPKA
jgi:hypothetical protein